MFLNRVGKLFLLPFTRIQNSLVASRPAMSKQEFVQQICEKGGNEDAANFLYSHLLEWVSTNDLTPYPDDSLSKVYGIAEEELDEDIVLELLKSLSINVPTPEFLRMFGRIENSIDVARLIEAARTSM